MVRTFTQLCSNLISYLALPISTTYIKVLVVTELWRKHPGRERKVAQKNFDDGEDENEVTKSTKTICTETVKVKDKELVDEFNYEELARAEESGDEMKEAYEILK